jgi:hypothetical protein
MTTSVRSAASSDARIAATRPSIMSEGATTSAPALAYASAADDNSGSVASLSTSTSPSAAVRNGPQ